ncbi:MAG: hypothetical protein O2923_07495 [Verrucomicrobia bacterium]|nr:hypothetical protein [Verrucomicrobiota bacterium]MDA1086976.1 hypothetical protein [Verrucomicrobiota bacterium]
MPEKHPNILHIFTDQQSADALSCAGKPHLAAWCRQSNDPFIENAQKNP